MFKKEEMIEAQEKKTLKENMELLKRIHVLKERVQKTQNLKGAK